MNRADRGPAARLLALAVSLLPAGRRDWGEAMHADFAALERGADRRRFARGCLRVALRQGAALRVGAYLAVEAAALVLAATSGIRGSFLIEVIALVLLVPPALWRMARPPGPLRIAPARSARLARRGGYALIATCALVGIAYIAAEVAPLPSGSGAATFWTGVIVVVLAGYTMLLMAVTAATSSVSSGAIASGAGFGAAAGLAGFALVPFSQSYAVHDPRLAAAYTLALAVVAVGAPATPAFVVARRSGDGGQGIGAGAIAGGVAALVLFIVGLAALRLQPGLLDSRVFDKGLAWLPSEPNADAQGYLGALVVLPLASFPIAALGAAVAGAHRRSWPVAAGVAGLLLAGLLCVPLKHALFDGIDASSFGKVGTTGVSFSADGRVLLTENAAQVSLVWNLAGRGGPVRTATFSGNAVFSPDGRTLATRGRLWRIAPGARPVRIGAFAGDGDPEAFSPDGRLLAVEGADGKPGAVWDMSDRARPHRLGTFTGQWGAFSPDGQTFATSAACWWDSPASATACGTTLWSVAGGTRPRRIAIVGGGGAQFSPDGSSMATCAINSTVVLWKLADPRHPTRTATLTVSRDDGIPGALIFSPDGRFLAAGGGDGFVKLWSVADPARAATLPPAHRAPNSGQIGISSTLTAAAFSRDGRTLTTVMGNDLATVWNISDPLHPIRTAVLTRRTRGAGVVAFSPDATTIAGAAVDGGNDVSLWRVR